MYLRTYPFELAAPFRAFGKCAIYALITSCVIYNHIGNQRTSFSVLFETSVWSIMLRWLNRKLDF